MFLFSYSNLLKFSISQLLINKKKNLKLFWFQKNYTNESVPMRECRGNKLTPQLCGRRRGGG